MHVLHIKFLVVGCFISLCGSTAYATRSSCAIEKVRAERVAALDADYAAKKREIFAEEASEKISLRRENLVQLRETGKCQNCYLAEADLTSIIKELNEKKMPINLEGADLSKTIMINSKLDYINLKYANLTGAIASGSSFRSANLESALLENVDFSDSDLTYTKMDGVSLGNLVVIKLRNTRIDGITINVYKRALLRASHYVQNVSQK